MTVVAHDEAQSLKARIFSAAIAVFAEHGLSGARMEQIATEAQTTKRMVVYYFKAKNSSIRRCCSMYARIRETEQQLGLERTCRWWRRWCGWCAGVRRYHATHADYMRHLYENMQRGASG